MQTSLLGQLEPTTIAQQQQKKDKGTGKDVLDQQDFLNLLVTQLKNQDPLNPTDNAEFMSQTTAFSQLNEMTTMNKSLNKMLEMLALQSYNNSSLTSGAGFIGKEIEYQTNTVMVGGDSLKTISFYLGNGADASKTQIGIYNQEGALVAVVKPDKIVDGQNTIHWDGMGAGGVKVPDGTYTFKVDAYDVSGKPVQVQEFGTGVVKGVKIASDGKLFFDIGDGVISSEYVYAVREAKQEEGGSNNGSKPDGGGGNNVEESEDKENGKKLLSLINGIM